MENFSKKIVVGVCILILLSITIAVSKKLTIREKEFQLATMYIKNDSELISKLGGIAEMSPHGSIKFEGSTTENPYVIYKITIHGKLKNADVRIKVVKINNEKSETPTYDNIDFY